MNLKRTFGAVLTVLGTIGLIYGAYAFLAGGASIGGVSMNQYSAAVPFFVGLIFFFAGIGLIKHTADHR